MPEPGSDDPLGYVRGFVCANFGRWGHKELGEEFMLKGVARLDARDQARVDVSRTDLGLLPSEWVSASLSHRVLDAVFAETPHEQALELMHSAGDSIFSAQISGLQRAIFALMLTPKRYVKYAPKAWRHNFTNGDIAFEATQNSHRCVYTNWTAHHPLMCRVMMTGKLAIYRAMGKKDARVEIVRCSGGDGCESVVHWGEAPA